MKQFYLNSKNRKAYVRFLTLAFFAFFTFAGFSQQPTDPSDIPNPLDDPSCTVTSGDCTSKDLELVGAFLDIDTTGCNSCDEGDQVVANLYLSINNTTGSTRTSFAVFGNLTITDPNGNVNVEAISRCSGSLPPSTITTLPYGQITYTCGDSLSLTDLVLSWTDASPNSTCENHDCAEIAPKCGTVDEIVITPPLQSAAIAQCDGPVIDVDLSVQGGNTPFTYLWTGPNGFTATTRDLNDVAPGTYTVIVKDADGCTTTASATQDVCCEFLASCNLDPTEQLIEGCDESSIPTPFTLPSEVFTVGPNPCGDLVLTYNDVSSGALCPDVLSVARTYTLFDDLNNNQILDAGEESATCVQSFKVIDTTDPTFTVPTDITIECNEDAQDLTVTGDVTNESDNCSSDIEATYTDNINSGSCATEYTITRTWTLTDTCGNTTSSDQTITVVDNNVPTFNEVLPANTVAAYDNIPAPEILTASDICDPNPQVTLDESYIGDNTSTTYIIVRTWTAADCAGNKTVHSQRIYVTENGDPIGLAINDITVNEGDGTANFTVTLTGEVTGGFTVDYNTVNGSAIAPGDFAAIAVSQLVYTGNHGETKSISVAINDDSIVEDMENYEVNLSNLSTTEIGINKSIGNGTILDNDSASIAVSDLIIDEAVGTAQIQVILAGNSEESFTVDFGSADDSAIAGSDYTAVNGQVTFPANSSNGAIEIINIPISDDSLIEPTEQFFVNLTGISSTGSITISDNQAIVSITDNDGDGAGVSFDATSVTVNEDAGTATFTVRLSGDVQGGFTLDYATANGSAQAPADFTAANGTLSFVGNDGEAYEITIPIIDDVIVEDLEDYVVDLFNISSPLIPILTPQATGVINDNDSESDFPSDILVSCDEIPEVPQITLNANGCEYTEVFEEVISGQDDECATEYTITRTWTITDCVENVRVHVQTITVEDTEAPVFVEQLPGDTTVSCNEVPFAAVMNALDNCDTAAYVAFDEILTGLDDECSSEYNITRTWTAWDCAGNSTVHVQNITVIDTEAPSFVESLPSDITVMCHDVSEAVVLTAVDNCDPDIDVVFNETITNDANCASGYAITRTWTVSDCAGNSVNHTQVVTISSAGPVTANEYEKEVSILCGDPLPGTPELEFSGGCGDYDIVFTEETEYSDDTDDYMVIRTWMVTDACANTASFEQLIFVFQPQLETVTIELCVEDAAIDLVNYLPEGFDTNGEFVVTSNNYTLIGSQLNPLTLDTDNQTLIEYSSTDGTCKYYVDFVINANTDCVPCGRDDIIASTTITPNGDGVNEYFEIKGVEFCDFRFDVILFNRWGTKVFEGKDYRNDWGAIAPNNAFGSKGLLPTGTYYYIIHVTNRNIEPITGYIYIGSN